MKHPREQLAKIAAPLIALGVEHKQAYHTAQLVADDAAWILYLTRRGPRPEMTKDVPGQIERVGDAARELLDAIDALSEEAEHRICELALQRHGLRPGADECVQRLHFLRGEASRDRRFLRWVADAADRARKARTGPKIPGDHNWALVVHFTAHAYRRVAGKAAAVQREPGTGAAAGPFAELLEPVLAAAGLPMLTFKQLDRYLTNYWPELPSN